MRIDFAWKQVIEGVSSIDVPEDEVRAWLDDLVTGGERAGNVGEITAEDCYEWLRSGDDSVWDCQIDPERDAQSEEFELDGLSLRASRDADRWCACHLP